MLTFAAILLAINVVLHKLYQERSGTSFAVISKFNAYTGLFSAIAFWAINGFNITFSLYSLIMTIISTAVLLICETLGFKLIKSGGATLYTIFFMTGGMIVPYIWELLCGYESFSVIRMIALILIIVGVVVSNFTRDKAELKKYILCIAVFLLNGVVNIVAKIHQTEVNYITVNPSEFLIYSGLLKFIVSIWFVRGENAKKARGIVPMTFILLSALAGGVASMLQLISAVNLPAGVLFPFSTGGSIVFAAAISAIFFKEKLSKKIIVSTLLCLVGTIMFI